MHAYGPDKADDDDLFQDHSHTALEHHKAVDETFLRNNPLASPPEYDLPYLDPPSHPSNPRIISPAPMDVHLNYHSEELGSGDEMESLDADLLELDIDPANDSEPASSQFPWLGLYLRGSGLLTDMSRPRGDPQSIATPVPSFLVVSGSTQGSGTSIQDGTLFPLLRSRPWCLTKTQTDRGATAESETTQHRDRHAERDWSGDSKASQVVGHMLRLEPGSQATTTFCLSTSLCSSTILLRDREELEYLRHLDTLHWESSSTDGDARDSLLQCSQYISDPSDLRSDPDLDMDTTLDWDSDYIEDFIEDGESLVPVRGYEVSHLANQQENGCSGGDDGDTFTVADMSTAAPLEEDVVLDF